MIIFVKNINMINKNKKKIIFAKLAVKTLKKELPIFWLRLIKDKGNIVGFNIHANLRNTKSKNIKKRIEYANIFDLNYELLIQREVFKLEKNKYIEYDENSEFNPKYEIIRIWF